MTEKHSVAAHVEISNDQEDTFSSGSQTGQNIFQDTFLIR